MVLVWHIIGQESGTSFLGTVTECSKAETKQSWISFNTPLKIAQNVVNHNGMVTSKGIHKLLFISPLEGKCVEKKGPRGKANEGHGISRTIQNHKNILLLRLRLGFDPA